MGLMSMCPACGSDWCTNCECVRKRVTALEALLADARRTHYHCEDSWYCCPQCTHPDHGLAPGEICGGNSNRDSKPSDACNCGAAEWNARVNAALA